MSEYEVIVGNIGTVYRGTRHFDARVEYNRAIGRSKRGEGRGANEPVTLMMDGEILREYRPPNEIVE